MEENGVDEEGYYHVGFLAGQCALDWMRIVFCSMTSTTFQVQTWLLNIDAKAARCSGIISFNDIDSSFLIRAIMIDASLKCVF